MRNTSLPAMTAKRPFSWVRLAFVTGIVLAAAFVARAEAATSLCADGAKCSNPMTGQPRETVARQISLTTNVQVLTGAQTATRNPQLSDQEYLEFSGVGAVVCTVHGTQRMSTAFLVGAFDLGVTVAHTFEEDGVWVQPENCVYTSTDSLGQIRERLPVSYIKAQWEAEDGAFGQPTKDFAVIRLSEPSRFAQRTMPLGKFSGAAAHVLMIGFNTDLDGDTVKRKTHGTVYDRKANGVDISSMAGFTHDMDAREIASGAPVIDETTGVIIGLHTQWLQPAHSGKTAARNTMITMNDWLERTLRSEMMAGRTASADH
jgi:hypothetical protein